MSLLKRYGWIGLLIVLVAVIILTKQSGSTAEGTTVMPQKGEETLQEEKGEQTEIKVDVKGEVKHPGVYSVKPGMRVDDVISIAGGLTEHADPTSVNLALKLKDEMVVTVSQAIKTKESSVMDDRLAINQATLEEIQSLNGIGPAKAAAIIQYREESGPFKDKEDLLKVSGIGEKTLNNFIGDIRIP